ncbi:queuosine precursor transporter [bacterium]|nr:queuosine precursor transporter [bacterium]MBU1065933.1 queuosine precursor transporter [bacterium]MBU1635648.1 queuosine precursor transporter [bacterium]MBU1872372.1 queuosine precursor transporter [bacterium]
MPNELIYFLMIIVVLSMTLFMFRMGKTWLYAYIAVCIVLANIFVTKQFTLFGLSATGGNITYGAIFLVTDMLCEHYGKEAGRKAVLIGFFAAVFYLITSQFILLIKPSEYDTVHEGMKAIFSFAPRIVLASMIAYLVSQFHDIWAYHTIRKITNNRMLWLRNNASTWTSQLIDSIIFSLIAFVGVFPMKIVLQIVLSTYLLKIIVAAIDTPFLYLSYRFLPDDLLPKPEVREIK